jgi:ABC-type transport system involved in cytochrome bd biosynthesis fused ATPase/permease subunit
MNLDLFFETIHHLKSKKTTVMVAAHNLDIIKKADYILYLDEESEIVKENFETLKIKFPGFDELTSRD